jgi:mannose-1-phosphate guanylyltransferase
MSQTQLYPVVMAGAPAAACGRCPVSCIQTILCLKGDLTMLQTTVCRLDGVECESPVVICNEQHRFIVAEQLRQLNKLTENIILEPAGATPHRRSRWPRWRSHAITRPRPADAGAGGGSRDSG